MSDNLMKKLHLAELEILRLKRHALAIENDTLRLRIKMNVETRRRLLNQIKKMNAEANPPLPF